MTGDAKHGLPTAKDEEVYLGLLQLTKLYNEFTSPIVNFTRLQLLTLLDWPNKDWSYDRARDLLSPPHRRPALLPELLARQPEPGMVRPRRVRHPRVVPHPRRPLDQELQTKLIDGGSEFRWSSVIFESFRSGYLKKLDYATVLKLGSTAKRLYRYLDKHFNPPVFVRLVYRPSDARLRAPRPEPRLRRDPDSPDLQPAIEELEAIGFLERLTGRAIPADLRRHVGGRARQAGRVGPKLVEPNPTQPVEARLPRPAARPRPGNRDPGQQSAVYGSSGSPTRNSSVRSKASAARHRQYVLEGELRGGEIVRRAAVRGMQEAHHRAVRGFRAPPWEFV